MKNPWKTHRSEVKYDNAWIEVREDQVTNPKGGKGIYGVVSFKNYALGVVPVDKDLNTWLVGQYRYPLEEYSWEIPMGGGPKSEKLEEAALRELKEETGLSSNKLTYLGKIHTSNSVTDEEGAIYLAEELTQGATEFDDTEDLAIRKLPLKEAVDMVHKGEITDAISIIGLLKAAKAVFNS